MTPVTWTATHLAAALETDNILYLADDDHHAAAIAAALAALCPNHTVVHLPSSDALPGDTAPASPANVGARVAAMRALHRARARGRKVACVFSGEAAAHRYPLPADFGQAPPRLAIGDLIESDQITAQLEDIGYFADDRVDEPGEMAVRGDVIDVFPADAGLPARVELADGAIVSIRSYDPLSQRSVADLDTLEIGRAAEPPREGGTSIFAHVDSGVVYFSDKADQRRRRYLQLAQDAERRPGGQAAVVDDGEWARGLARWRTVALDPASETVPRFAEARAPLAALTRFAAPLIARGRRFVLAGSARDLRFLRGKIAKRLGIEFAAAADWNELMTLGPGAAAFIEMPADQGFMDDKAIWIAAADLLGSRALIGEAPVASSTPWTAGTADLHVGDVVIHEDHGIGIVAGLEPAPSTAGAGGEMIALEYASGARRLVGHEQADRIWRYGADDEAVTLDKLDGSSWQKRRKAIDAAIAESAQGLAALAKSRAKLIAPVIEPDAAAYERFAADFPFNETADQAKAISAVRDDLARGTPMDRLIVGDVGYGKTEVALRAAALAALAGYQVVVAAPTTVLVRQHLAGFARRFAAAGIAVAGLSRLSNAAEKKAVKAGLADGSLQIVVGTGAVMAKDVTFANLGLVIIDEEQRFGAADKSRLRGSGQIHLLTLSATPIPRTLQMALIGLQQVSVIATPPARRQPIRTSLDQFDDSRIRIALHREKGRGGQSFVVVPRIEDMAPLAEKLHRVVPELGIVEAHGKMPAADIDAVMVGFAEGLGDVLLATNIIEAGLDVPRANTMVVWRADRFGLAQLHQLRGRVGRGNRRGQIILLTDAADTIGDRTMKRLRTLAAFDRLGAGFAISARDLDMRGAGDLLGETQAGHMKLIGVDLYQHLLRTALRQVRGEEVERWTPELNLGARGELPDSWVPEPDLRLSLYVRLARIEDEAGLDGFEEELLDRFGPLPDGAELLLAQARLRLAARMAHVARVDAGPSAVALTMRRPIGIDPASLGLTVTKDRLLLKEAIPEPERGDRLQALLEALAA